MNSLQALIDRFPRLFRGQGPRVPGYVDDGWRPLVLRPFEEIDRLLSDDEAAAFQVHQIKEKYGGLCVYVGLAGKREVHVDLSSPAGVRRLRINPAGGELPSPLERVHALIDEAAAQAAVTCEQCGAPGRQRLGNWIRTLCDRHEAERSPGQTSGDLPEDGT